MHRRAAWGVAVTTLAPRVAKRRTEATVLAEIRIACNMLPGVRLFRNNSGRLEDATGRWVTFGLAPGSADLIGIARGRFLSIEVKHGRGVESADQRAWRALIRELGGIAIVARSAEDALEQLRAEGI